MGMYGRFALKSTLARNSNSSLTPSLGLAVLELFPRMRSKQGGVGGDMDDMQHLLWNLLGFKRDFGVLSGRPRRPVTRATVQAKGLGKAQSLGIRI